MKNRPRIRLVSVVVAALLVIPAAVVFGSDYFSDVPTGAFYHDAVSAIANAGLTAGCGGDHYCPSAGVTRGQMAVFLDRLGALDGKSQPVVNALTTNGFIAYQFIHTVTLDQIFPASCSDITNPGGAPFGDFTEHYTYVFGPVATYLINVQIADNPNSTTQDFSQSLCFARIDGQDLPAGDYVFKAMHLEFVGEGLFDASGRTRTASARPAHPRSVRTKGGPAR